MSFKTGKVLDMVEVYELVCRRKAPGGGKDDYQLLDSYRALLADNERLASEARGGERSGPVADTLTAIGP